MRVLQARKRTSSTSRQTDGETEGTDFNSEELMLAFSRTFQQQSHNSLGQGRARLKGFSQVAWIMLKIGLLIPTKGKQNDFFHLIFTQPEKAY